MAPEILLKQEYNKSVDIWSAGVVMYQLISGKHPMSSFKIIKTESYVDVLFLKPKIELLEKDGFTKLSQDLLKRMLEYSIIYRFNAD